MDILQPQLTWIGTKCYRMNIGDTAGVNKTIPQQQQTNEYIENDLYGIEDDDEPQTEINVIEVSPSRYKTVFRVPQAFFGAIIGAKGSVKKRIEGETRTEITIPQRGSSDITIIGTNRDSVCQARRRIDLIVIGCRNKQRPTHFTCARITDTTIINNAKTFKEEILRKGPTLGLQEDMFISPEKLHITINVMGLMDDDDRSLAVKLMEEIRETIVIPNVEQHKKIEVSICGVEIMNDDPSSVRVLYGKVESIDLQSIVDSIAKRFIKAGLSKIEHGRESVKMHVTLINTKKAKDDGDGNKGHFKPKTFDARHILEDFANFEFGTQQINEINLAIMETKDADGFYKCTTSIKF